MRRAGLLLAVLIAGVASGEEAQPRVTVSAGWDFTTQQQGEDAWTTAEKATASLAARWSALDLEVGVSSDFSNAPLTGDVLERLALTWTEDWGLVTVGKQRLSWGTARVLSSLANLEPAQDPTSTETPRGVTGARVELLPSDWLSVSLLALPAPRLDDALVATKWDVVWEETDLSLGALRTVEAGSRGDRREAPAVFGTFARFFDRFGFYGEGQLRLSDGRWRPQGTAGTQMEFPVWLNGTLRWLTEYRYNGDRRLPSVGSYRRHYMSSALSGLPLAEKVWAGGSVLGNEGGLLVASASVSWEITQALSASAAYDRFTSWKTGDSELAFLPIRHRVTVSVDAAY